MNSVCIYRIRKLDTGHRENDFLMHHGISGQQWGVRRFQNKNGTLTPEGRERYLKNYEKAEKSALRKITNAQKELANLKKSSAPDDETKDWLAKEVQKKPKDLSQEDTALYTRLLKYQIKEAKTELENAQKIKEFIQQNDKITIDGLLSEAEKLDIWNNRNQMDIWVWSQEMGLDSKKLRQLRQNRY